MSINTIHGVLEQIQRQSNQTSMPPSVTQLTGDDGKQTRFSDMLMNSIGNISHTQLQAQHQAESYLAGAPGIGLNDVMVSLQKSSLSLNLGVQVRNKMVSAYQDIMNMPV